MNLVDRLFPRRNVAAASGAPSGSPSGSPSPQDAGPSKPALPADPKLRELQVRRDALAEQLAERQWDLGGVTYEMAIRDHFRLDVLVRLAADLQDTDAELAEVERLLRLESSAAAGECPSCRAPHSRGALYCWSCGAQLMHKTGVGSVPAPTVVKAP